VTRPRDPVGVKALRTVHIKVKMIISNRIINRSSRGMAPGRSKVGSQMKIRSIISSFFLTLGVVTAQSQIIYKISKIEANLFYSGSGTFSENIIDNQKYNLWNTIIGEGSAGKPSEQTLVKIFVQASGKGQSNAEGISLEVKITGGNSTVLKRVFPLNLFDSNRINCYGILVDDTGCTKISIAAKLIGKGGGSQMMKSIEFECGE
jgi:hypothetical protein